MRRTVAVISTWVVLLVGLSGCGSEPKPKEPSGRAISSEPPPLPVSATHDTVQGRVAFAGYWLELMNLAAATGNTGPFLSLARDCEACESLARDTDHVRYRGRRITSSAWNVDSVEPYGPDNVYLRINVKANPKYHIDPHTLGIWISPDPPYTVADVWQVQR